MSQNLTITINGKTVNIIRNDKADYVCLTQIVDVYTEGQGNGLIEKWLSSKNTVEYLGAWEDDQNPDFNYPEFGVIRNEAGVNRFYLSVKRWVEKTNAIGIEARAGRYGGTFAHEDIAMEFCTWLDPIFKLLVIKEFKRLKVAEAKQLNTNWDAKRFTAKVNFKIQTDAVKQILIPDTNLPEAKHGILYAQASDIIYYAMFGYTSKEWKEKNPELAKKGWNIRDVANTHQLIVLANLENIDALLLKNGIKDKYTRIKELRKEALSQVKILRTSTEIQHELIESPHLAEQKKISEMEKPKQVTPNLSEFNNKLKTALNYNPKKES